MYSLIQAAGWPIWPLIACSIITLALIIERAMSLRRMKVAPRSLVDEVQALLAKGRPTSSMLEVLASSCLFGRVLSNGLRAFIDTSKESAARDAFTLAGREAVHELERYLPYLALLATAAPLLGLFGTVVGMIEIFSAQGAATGANPQQLAHGISVALYNTAMGLVVAIVALIAHRVFKQRAMTYVHEMELGAERVLQQIAREDSPA